MDKLPFQKQFGMTLLDVIRTTKLDVEDAAVHRLCKVLITGLLQPNSEKRSWSKLQNKWLSEVAKGKANIEGNLSCIMLCFSKCDPFLNIVISLVFVSATLLYDDTAPKESDQKDDDQKIGSVLYMYIFCVVHLQQQLLLNLKLFLFTSVFEHQSSVINRA